MLTDRQITDIAREFAEELIDPCGFSKGTYEELVDEKAEDVAYIFRWLSKRFCLVEKGKVEEEYRKCMLIQMDDNPNLSAEYIGNAAAKMGLIELLFPEIAKEVEDE